MRFFETYTSNSIAGSGNQYVFCSDKTTVCTGRVYYKITHAGKYSYALLFSNIIDSTFADGKTSHKNLICGEWEILSACIARCPADLFSENFVEPEAAVRINDAEYAFIPLTFDGNSRKCVHPGEFFTSDPVAMEFAPGEYLCLELTFVGSMIPYHEETLLPVYRKTVDGWVYDRRMPFAGMIGCDRPVQKRIAYLGDSITQGIGTPLNAYSHWCAVLADKLGQDYAHWNLGLGYGRAEDLASDGAWLYKAQQNDVIVVCCGVNDILQGRTDEQIKQDLGAIITSLSKAGKRIVLQTVPPFDYTGENIRKWESVNKYIRSVLAEKADLLFDVVPILQKSESEPYMAKYGGHPDAQGCMVWSEALYGCIMKSGLLS